MSFVRVNEAISLSTALISLGSFGSFKRLYLGETIDFVKNSSPLRIIYGYFDLETSTTTIKVLEDNNGSWLSVGNDVVISGGYNHEIKITNDGLRFGTRNNSGVVKIYDYNSSTSIWDNTATINANLLNTFVYQSENFAIAKGIKTRFVISSDEPNVGGGIVKVYDEGPPGTWTEVINNGNSALLQGGPLQFLGFCCLLSDDGNTLAISGPSMQNIEATLLVNQKGIVRVLDYDTSLQSWNRRGLDIEGDVLTSFGHSISISDDTNTIVIGSPTFGTTRKGKVFVFNYNGVNWTNIYEINSIYPSEKYFGYQVAINSDSSIISIITNRYTTSSFQVYRRTGSLNQWLRVGNDILITDLNQNHTGFNFSTIAMNGDGKYIARGYYNINTIEIYKIFDSSPNEIPDYDPLENLSIPTEYVISQYTIESCIKNLNSENVNKVIIGKINSDLIFQYTVIKELEFIIQNYANKNYKLPNINPLDYFFYNPATKLEIPKSYITDIFTQDITDIALSNDIRFIIDFFYSFLVNVFKKIYDNPMISSNDIIVPFSFSGGVEGCLYGLKIKI